MNIFLTGGTGFLGQSIRSLLPQHSYFLYERSSNVIDDLKSFKPDAIIHSAGEIYDKSKMFDSNVQLTYDILSYIQNNDVPMIYFGSSSEYGKINTPMAENSLTNPETLYAATKSAGTLLCQAFAREYGRAICTIRPFSVYGENEPSHRLIPTVYRKLKTGENINIIRGTHDFIYIRDFIRLVDIILNSPKDQIKGDIVNAGTGTLHTNENVVHALADILDIDPKYTLINKFKECDAPLWKCNPTYARQKYGFIAQYDIYTGLEMYVNSFKS